MQQEYVTKKIIKNTRDTRIELFNAVSNLNPRLWHGAWIVYSWKTILYNTNPVQLTLLKAINAKINREHGMVYLYRTNNRRNVYYVPKNKWELYLELFYYYLFEYDGNDLSDTTFTHPFPLNSP
jgi:hypothetical protein